MTAATAAEEKMEATPAPAPMPIPVAVPSSVLSEWSPEHVVGQLAAIQTLMKNAMQKDEDFGIIPGCKKPSLLKPGAEKLGLMFRLSPSYVITTNNLERGHREVVIVCTLTHIPTGRVMGSGIGSCSTMEVKYRWRQGARKCPKCGKEGSIIKGKAEYGGGWVCWKKKEGCDAKFKDGDATIEGQSVEKVENPDLADQYNTVLKMAKKRAHVDAALTVTAASQIFTQDVEENAPEHAAHEEAKPEAKEPGEVTEVRALAMACKTLPELSALKQKCIDKAGPWRTAEIKNVLNTQYFQITGKVAPNEPA